MKKTALSAGGFADASYRPTSKEIQAVLRFLPRFEATGFKAGKPVIKPGMMPWFRYAKAVDQFEQALYANGFIFLFNWSAWHRTAARYESDHRLLRRADLQTIRKLLCAQVRVARLSEGHLAEVIENGFIPAVLRRLQKLNSERRMKGLLVRVGIDGSDEGRWNAPVDSTTWSFAYVPIVETKIVRHGFERSYDELQPNLKKASFSLPPRLVGRRMHLDPDFEALTYGDQGSRAEQIRRLEPGDILVFYAGLRDSTDPRAELVYALIGLYVIQEIVPATSVKKELWKRNAHTRRIPGSSDIVVRARSKVSGRLKRCVPIGEYRNAAYRVKEGFLREWGGLTVKDGWLQRSAHLPAFTNVNLFYRWFRKLDVPLLRSNNP